MEYNNYYPAGHPPPPPHMQPNQQHGSGYSQMQLGAGNMMHIGPGPPPPPPQVMRQVVTPGPPPGHPQMQPQPPPPQSQQQPPPQPIMGGLPQHMQQQPNHPGYHHPPPPPLQHPHSSLPHSGSPHLNQQQQQPNINMNMNLQPPSRPSTGPSPQHPMHQQSPHLVGGPPPPPPPQMHIQQQQQTSQQLNHVGGPSPMPLGNNQPQPGMQQQPNHNFMSPGPIPPSPHYNHPNQHQPPLPPPLNQAPPPTSIPPPMHHHHHVPAQGPPPLPPPQSYLPHQPHLHQPSLERGSPFYQNIPQTEFRIIELNKRLQNRPRPRGPPHPLPQMDSGDSYWWEKFACDFFDNDATLTLRTSTDDKPVEYTIGRTLIPRFFRSFFEGGVVDLSIKLRSTRETVHHHLITLDCDQTDITTKNVFKYRDLPMYVVVHTEGHLSLEFVSNSFDTLLIKSWRFYTNQCREYIDRTMTTAAGLPQTFLTEPVTRFGLTKQTIAYLKMCMIMEPMQELMLQHRQTQMNPKSCLKHLLLDKYKLKSVEDNRAQPNRRRKRKPPNTTGVTKKTKANANNANTINNNHNNNMGFNNINNSLMSSPTMHGGGGNAGGPGGGVMPNLSLASQDVMVVGEPSMLGADFGDENERRITRLENNQFDSSVNNNSNNNNSTNNNINNSNNISQQNHNQMCNNSMNQNPNQPNNMNRIPPQQNNHDTGNIQMMNHLNSNNNGNNDNKPSDPSKSNNSNGNNCLQNNSNNHPQMNLITMNGNNNHLNHIIKSEIDLKQSAATPTPVDSEQTR